MYRLQILYHDCTLNEKICMKLYNPIKTLKNINLYLKKKNYYLAKYQIHGSH